MAQNAAPVPFGGAAPDTGLLPETQCVIETCRLNGAPLAHGLRSLRLGFVFGVEDRSLQPLARSEVPPLGVLRIDLLYRHVIAPNGPD